MVETSQDSNRNPDHGSPIMQQSNAHDASATVSPLWSKRKLSALDSERQSTVSKPAKKQKLNVQWNGSEEESEAQDSERRLACPFFKRKPTNTRLSCVYPGFSSIARLKEHLYRQHMLPQHLCSRCLETFKSETELREHSRAPVPCQVDTETHIEGITLEQEKALKSKKRTSKSGSNSDEEKWRDIYGILFPDEKVPSAFCDTVSGSPLSEEILRLELPSLVRTKILKHVQLREHSETIVDVIQRCLGEIFSRLQHNANEGQQVSALPTATKTSPSSPHASVADADGAPRIPRGTETSAHDSASPRSTLGVAESTRNVSMNDMSAHSDVQAMQEVAS